MSTAIDLIEEVQDVIQDDAYDEDMILALINKAMDVISAKVLLPGLETTSTVSTTADENTVALPVDYHRELFKVHNDSIERDVIVFSTTASLYRMCLGAVKSEAGNVKAVAMLGNNLRIHFVPTTAQDLTLWYYRKPASLVADTDEPDGLPLQFHDMLTNYAAWKLFDKIEDGIEGKKVNTDHYMTLFIDALENGLPCYVEDLGVSRREPPVVRGEFL
ncbi:MAG: hypothetical protein KKD63_11085 [Proteobacteria bacterium]|nr:hypothetical protein [Desulfobulbaceae bacterium]MBU4153415.1 hypothetical protein [Pseudomonadota bacterium]